MKTYQTNQIKSQIANKGDQCVFMYGESSVIKFSKLGRIFAKRAQQRYREDYQICCEYFGYFIVPMESVQSPDQKKSAWIQPFITGEPLTKKYLSDSKIRQQFETILIANKKLKKNTNQVLDMIGLNGIIAGNFSNILVDKTQQLKIIDTTLFSYRGMGMYVLLFLLPFELAKNWQQHKINQWMQ
jgi:hypothetical protein